MTNELFIYHHDDIRENVAIFVDELSNAICCNCHLLAKTNIWTFLDILIFCKNFFNTFKKKSMLREKGEREKGK